MSASALFLARLVLLNLIFCQVQVHGENLRLGPPLRFYNGDPDSHKLETKIDGKVLVGEDLSLEVSLPDDDSATISSCQWTSPYGAVYVVDKDNIEGEICIFHSLAFSQFVI